MGLKIFVKNTTKTKLKGVESFLEEMATLIPFISNKEISVLFCGEMMIKNLNKNYRSKNKATDVLSFPAQMDYILGDIVISIPTAKKQAKISLLQEIETLLCHGLLHLVGYDHEKSQKDYKIMMDLQQLVLDQITKRVELL